ncbi:phosphatidylglycerophosphatase and protein-tyrosine phosphatase 1 isoform X2 [Epinephelus lanceolatus]
MSGALARLLFYPTLAYNVFMEKVTSRRWFDRVDDTVILGALPFRSITKQLVETENVRGVITMNEEYETKYFCNSAEPGEPVPRCGVRLAAPREGKQRVCPLQGWTFPQCHTRCCIPHSVTLLDSRGSLSEAGVYATAHSGAFGSAGHAEEILPAARVPGENPGRTCKLEGSHTEGLPHPGSNWQSPCCEATVLTTTPPCRPEIDMFMFILFRKGQCTLINMIT